MLTTRNKLRETAIRLFGEKGYDGTALSEIAKAVGVKTPAIYAFYENKEDLFITAFKEAMQAYNQFIQDLHTTKVRADARTKLRNVLARQYEFYVESTETNLFVIRTLLFPPAFLKEDVDKAFADSDRLLNQVLEDILVQGMEESLIPDQKIQPLADAFLTLMDGLAMQYFYYGSKEVFERKLEHGFDMFWRSAEYVTTT